jgi:hypothetical protein
MVVMVNSGYISYIYRYRLYLDIIYIFLYVCIIYLYLYYINILCMLNTLYILYVRWTYMYIGVICISLCLVYIYIHMSMRIVDGCKNRFGGVTCMIICMKMDTQWRHAYLRFNCMVLYQHLCACTFMYMIYCTQMSASKRVMLLDRILRSLLQDGPPVISWLLKTMNTIVI